MADKIVKTVTVYGNKTNTAVQQRIPIPKEMAAAFGSNPGDTLLMEFDGEKIIVKKV